MFIFVYVYIYVYVCAYVMCMYIFELLPIQDFRVVLMLGSFHENAITTLQEVLEAIARLQHLNRSRMTPGRESHFDPPSPPLVRTWGLCMTFSSWRLWPIGTAGEGPSFRSRVGAGLVGCPSSPSRTSSTSSTTSTSRTCGTISTSSSIGSPSSPSSPNSSKSS